MTMVRILFHSCIPSIEMILSLVLVLGLAVSGLSTAPETFRKPYNAPCYADDDDPPPRPDVPVDYSTARREDIIARPIPRKCTKTLIVVILDESGSMSVQKEDVIGGYNNFLDTQKEIRSDQARLILLKFNTRVTIAHGARRLEEVPKLNRQSYKPGGGTALYDAVAEGIMIGEGAAQPGERVLVLIMTDGMENSSRKYGSYQVRKMMSDKEELGSWTFAYIGENPEAWAKEMDQPVHNVRVYDMHHQRANMDAASGAVSNFRKQSAPQSKAFFK